NHRKAKWRGTGRIRRQRGIRTTAQTLSQHHRGSCLQRIVMLRYQTAMLYESWRQIASAHRQETALVECASGRRWSFGELAAQAEKKETTPGPISYPQGITAEFVLAVLQAWRAGQVLLPLEP